MINLSTGLNKDEIEGSFGRFLVFVFGPFLVRLVCTCHCWCELSLTCCSYPGRREAQLGGHRRLYSQTLDH